MIIPSTAATLGVMSLGMMQLVLGQLDRALPYKMEAVEPRYFGSIGSKRVKITYGPLEAPSVNDEKHGHFQNRNVNAPMPCGDCLILGWTPDLFFANGKQANANSNIWLHHIGISNMNRTDSVCDNDWPERMNVNGNERSPFDFTLKGTRKAGYYLRKTDHIFMATEIANMNVEPQTLFLTMDIEYIEGTPEGFDIVVPAWLDVKGNCLDSPLPPKDARIFTARNPAAGYVAKWDADLILAVSHIHDGNTKQEIFLDDKLVCSSVPSYGESAEFVSHSRSGGDGHGHDHGTDEHHYHVSSITQCTDVVKVTKGSKFTIASHYDMEKHTPQKDHEGKEEAIMAIQFLHFARPQAEAIKDILASKNGNVTAFSEQVAKNNAGATEPIKIP